MVRPVRHPGTAWPLVGILLAGLLVAGPARAHQPGGHRPALLTPVAIPAVAMQLTTQHAALCDARLPTQLALRAPFPPDPWPQWQARRKGMAHRGMQRTPGVGPGL
jgi:hypothetical protein